MIPPSRDWNNSHSQYSGEISVKPVTDVSYTATTALYQHCAPKLLNYLTHHLRSDVDAEDMLYDVFVIAFEHEQELLLMPESEQRAWLWTVARNKMVDYHRRRQRRPVVALDHLAEMEGHDGEPEQTILQREEQASLQVYMQSLTALQQEVLQLRFSGGLRCAEIAVVLNKQEGAIRTLLSRAVDALRKIYMQQGKS